MSLRNLVKKYGQVEAVKSIDLEVYDHEFMCLLGPSGCGKSSTLRMVAGLEDVTSGDIYIGDRRVNDLWPKDRDIAMVFENYALYPHLTTFENIAFPLRARRMPESEIRKRVGHAAEVLDITSLLDRPPANLSGGQQQRVAIGRCIVREPAVFLMDEPISHLDAKLRDHMRGELKRLQKTLATTTIYVSHDQIEAMTMGDRIAVMKDGLIQQVGPPREVFDRPANMFVAYFVGSPSINFIRGTLTAKDGGLAVKWNGFTFTVSPEQAAVLRNAKGASEIVLGIRPQNIILAMQERPGMSLRGEIFVTQPLGEEMLVEVTLGETRLIAVTEIDFPGQMGDPVWVDFDRKKVHIFDGRSEDKIA
ncbi:MAG: ABC transporter ATP-binding protein [Patescibacteria group bacterium]